MAYLSAELTAFYSELRIALPKSVSKVTRSPAKKPVAGNGFDLSGILNHLGIIKNELLIFTILVIIVTNSFGRSLIGSEDQIIRLLGGCMHLSTIPMVFGFGFFYVYAVVRLPGSTQELKFQESAKEAVQTHEDALEKNSTTN